MACVGDSILTNYDGSLGADAKENNGTGSPTYSQSFQIPNDADICALSFYGGKGTVGTQPGTYKIEIKTGSPNGTVIATTGSLSTSGMHLYTSPDWTKAELTTPVALTGLTTYYMVMTSLTGSTNDVFRWFRDNTGSYSDGSAYVGTSIQTGKDNDFRVHGVESGSGTDYPITASVGAFTLTGIATALQIGLQIIASVGTFTLSGIASALNIGRSVVADAGSFTYTTVGATLIAGGRLLAEAGTYTLTGISATLGTPLRMVADAGAFVLTGIDTLFESGKRMVASVATFTVTGLAVVFTLGKGMVTSVGNFTLTGFTTTLTWTKRIVAVTGSFVLTGISALLKPSNIWSNTGEKNNADWVNKDKS